MKLHWPIANGVVLALIDIFDHGMYADKVVHRYLKSNRKWGARDRRFFAESVYDIVRWWRRLLYAVGVSWQEEEFLNQDITRQSSQSDGEELSFGLYSQDQVWTILVAWLKVKGLEVPEWAETRTLTPEVYLRRWNEVGESLPLRESLPEWLNQLGLKEVGAGWPQMVQVLNEVAPVFLRVNTLKTHPQQVIESLEKEGITAHLDDSQNQVLKLEERSNLFSTRAFKQGWFEVQDKGSQQIAPFLEVHPGQRVIDACAGAGGKSLHLSSSMKNKGKIVALDVHAWKLKELKRRARRAGADIIEVRPIENSKVIKRLHHSADRLLLDVPCTGLGVIRRNPDTKWKLNPARYAELVQLQRQLLLDYSKMVKPGGKLVYATCSVLASENEKQILWFLSQFETSWALEEELRLHPETNSHDGFYAARLIHSPQ